MQYQGPTTTEKSKDEGRLKIDAGLSYKNKKKKLLKNIVKKYAK
jgi:hypothetical protein